MSNSSIFDILGPIMIGPSSSHTAGALYLGKVAQLNCGASFHAATFYLHGSFARTYQGHGTDRALIAGILGMDTEDERIKSSPDIAREKGIEITFVEADLGDVHANTVKIVLDKDDGGIFSITGSSIGGGNIVITDINGDKFFYDCKYPVLIVKHYDKPGMISKISAKIASYDINIAYLKFDRVAKGETATAIIETDSRIPEDAIAEIEKIEGIISVRGVSVA